MRTSRAYAALNSKPPQRCLASPTRKFSIIPTVRSTSKTSPPSCRYLSKKSVPTAPTSSSPSEQKAASISIATTPSSHSQPQPHSTGPVGQSSSPGLACPTLRRSSTTPCRPLSQYSIPMRVKTPHARPTRSRSNSANGRKQNPTPSASTSPSTASSSASATSQKKPLGTNATCWPPRATAHFRKTPASSPEL